MRKEDGVSLVEVLVSIVLLGIILTGFSGLFVQGAKTNRHADVMIDTAALAQTELERLHEVSAGDGNFSKDKLTPLGYAYVETITSEEVKWLVFARKLEGGRIDASLRIEDTPKALKRTIVEIKEANENTPTAKMEGVAVW